MNDDQVVNRINKTELFVSISQALNHAQIYIYHEFMLDLDEKLGELVKTEDGRGVSDWVGEFVVGCAQMGVREQSGASCGMQWISNILGCVYKARTARNCGE